jgi:hypothetical protein
MPAPFNNIAESTHDDRVDVDDPSRIIRPRSATPAYSTVT